LEDVHTDDRII